MMKFFFLVFSLVISSISLNAQNLISNSGFETNNGWSILKLNDPILVKADSTHSALKGKNAIGVYVSDMSQAKSDNRTFIQTKLSKPLIKGKYYRFKVHCKLSEYSTHSSRSLGAMFTNENISDEAISSYINNNPSIDFGVKIGSNYYNNKAIKNSSHLKYWTKENTVFIDQIYEAKGGEQYLTIGNFYDKNSIYLYHLFNYGQNENTYSYYILDEVSLVEVKMNK